MTVEPLNSVRPIIFLVVNWCSRSGAGLSVCNPQRLFLNHVLQDVGLVSDAAYVYSENLEINGANEACQISTPQETFKISGSEDVPAFEGALQRVSFGNEISFSKHI